MKIYNSRFLPKVEKAARKARNIIRENVYSCLHPVYTLGHGVCTFEQGQYAIRGRVPTTDNEMFLCNTDLELYPQHEFFIDSKGNASQTVANTLITHNAAFEPIGNFNPLHFTETILDLKSVESLVNVNRNALIELLQMMEGDYVAISIVNNKDILSYPFLKIDGKYNNAFMYPIIKKK